MYFNYAQFRIDGPRNSGACSIVGVEIVTKRRRRGVKIRDDKTTFWIDLS